MADQTFIIANAESNAEEARSMRDAVGNEGWAGWDGQSGISVLLAAVLLRRALHPPDRLPCGFRLPYPLTPVAGFRPTAQCRGGTCAAISDLTQTLMTRC